MGNVRRLLFPALLVFALSAPAWACLWYYGKNVKGEDVTVEGRFGRPERLVEFLTQHPEHEKALTTGPAAEPDSAADFRVRSDYAATLIHQGKAAKAIPILEALEEAHPNEYVLAANLGTAYELNGENEKALHWIREGMGRNPDSHGGTEWLHVRILEAKIAASKEPDWSKSHTVLGLDFGTGDVPGMPARFPEGQSAKTVRNALIYQLHERLAFVRPPDPLVAGLIADLADLEGLQETADHAAPLYDLALTYKPVNAELLLRRKAQALQHAGHLLSAEQRRQQRIALGIGLVVLLFVGSRIRSVMLKRPKSAGPPPSGG